MAASNTEEVHVEDIGTVISVTIKRAGVAVDISSATLKNFIIVTNEAVRKVCDTVFSTDGTDGILTYTTVSGDLPTAGRYKIQAQLTITGWSGKSSIGEFEVIRNL
jgi:hypothetical protein